MRDEYIAWLRVDPKLDPLREDPRFLKLLREVGAVAMDGRSIDLP